MSQLSLALAKHIGCVTCGHRFTSTVWVALCGFASVWTSGAINGLVMCKTLLLCASKRPFGIFQNYGIVCLIGVFSLDHGYVHITVTTENVKPHSTMGHVHNVKSSDSSGDQEYPELI